MVLIDLANLENFTHFLLGLLGFNELLRTSVLLGTDSCKECNGNFEGHRRKLIIIAFIRNK